MTQAQMKAGQSNAYPPCLRLLYPTIWNGISHLARVQRARNRCERCGAQFHKPHPEASCRVFPTVPHPDPNPAKNDKRSMVARYQRWSNLRRDSIRAASNHGRVQVSAGQLDPL